MCGKVGAGDGGADVADPGADAVGEDVVACAVVAADSAVEYGSGGDVSVWRPVSREVMERELARWKGVLDRLGDVDAGGADTDNTDTGE